jgi:hypothetical protein
MVAQGLAPPTARALHVWRRPTDLGLTAQLVVHLIFPTDHFHGERPIGKHNRKVLIFEGRAGKAVEFGFFYSQACTPAMLEQKFGQMGKPIFRTELANGECVSMVAREAEFDPSVLSGRVDWRPVNSLSNNEIAPNSKLNMILFNEPSDGEPLLATEIGGVIIRRSDGETNSR